MQFRSFQSIVVLAFWVTQSCSPAKVPSTARSSSAAGGAPGETSSTQFSNAEGEGDETSDSTTTKTTSTQTSGPLVEKSALDKMTDAQLLEAYTQRLGQLLGDQHQIKVTEQIGGLLCARLQDLQASCLTSNLLIPGGDNDLDCGVGAAAEAKSLFTVALTDTSGKALTSVDGKFVLVANSNFASEPFGAGTTPIKFTSKAGSLYQVQAPQISRITKLEIKRDDEVQADILAGKGKLLFGASKTPFFVQLMYKGTKLTDGMLLDYPDAAYKGYRNLINLQNMATLASSGNCSVPQAEVDSIKKQVSSGIPKVTVPDGSKLSRAQKITKITDAQTLIAGLTTQIQHANDRIMHLTSALSSNTIFGCHAGEPILSMSITIRGKKLDPKPLGNYDICPVIPPTGPGSILSVQMGSSVNISIDSEKTAIGSTPTWTGTAGEDVLVADLEYLRISKLGIDIKRGGRECKSMVLGISSSCADQCIEQNMFGITGISISIDTPSVSARPIYDQNFNVTLGSRESAPDYVLNWTDNAFRTNPTWVKFIGTTDCDKSN